MTGHMAKWWMAAAGLVAGLHSAGWAQEQAWPQRAIRIIVPFAGGSGSDATARYYAEKMAPMLGQSIIVENKPGADGAIGMAAAKAAPADGYTLVQGGISPSVVNAVLVKDLPYDPVKDFVPLLGYGRNMNVLVTGPGSPHADLSSVLRRAREGDVPLNVGTFSTTLSLAVSWLASATQSKFTNIPYKGQAQVLTDVMGGQVDLGLVDLGGASTLIRNGKVRALAVTGEQRSPDFPQVPTVQESGAQDYVLYSWNAFFVRSETPEHIRTRLAQAIRAVMVAPETVEKFYRPKGTEGVPLAADRMRALQLEEIERFRKIAQSVAPAAR